MTELSVNARFLRRPITGVERVAHEVLARLRRPVRRLEPPSVAASGLRGHLWEQTALPSKAPGLLWSPCNTGPIRHRRHVVTIHDLAPLQHPEWFSRRFALTYRTLIPRLCRTAAAVVTVSDAVAADLGDLGVGPDRLRVIGSGVDPRFRVPTGEEITQMRIRLLLEDRPYLLVLGSTEPRKNLARVVDAWSRIDHGDVRLVLAGAASASVFRSMEFRPESFTDVTVLGRVDEELLPALLGGARACLSLSLYEGFGLPPIEALACGTPVLVSDIAAHRATLGDLGPNAASFADPLDTEAIAAAMASLVDRTPSPGTVTSEAMHRRFDWDRTAASYDELFDRLSDS